MINMKIAIGCDEAAFELKELIRKHLVEKGHTVFDAGTYDTNPVNYPDKAIVVAEKVAEGEYERGILVCGTGIGMAITANKVKGIRAAVCHDLFSTERSILSNNSQIMCMGARVIAPEYAIRLVDVWVGLKFDGGKSAEKVACISSYEEKYYK